MEMTGYGQAPAEDLAGGVAPYYYDLRFTIAEDRPMLERLIESVGWTNDLAPYQWAQWYATVLGFRPDLILELGRGRGNSTALFLQAVDRLGSGRIESICVSRSWNATRSRIERFKPQTWFESLTARNENILSVNFADLIRDSKRTLVLWDAHGFAIAERVLADLLPLLVERPHLVILHDISDTRHLSMPDDFRTSSGRHDLPLTGDYQGRRVWQGGESAARGSRVRIGWMDSAQEQVVALADFLSRNELELGSADHDYNGLFGPHPELADEMVRAIGPALFSVTAHWAYLTLPADGRKLYFPPSPPPRRRYDRFRSDAVARAVRLLRSLD